MDIVVCVKTNPDLQMVRIKNREAVTEAVPYKIGDLEKNALEAAVELRDAVGGKVVALCLAEGNRKAAEDIKVALAMGADEAVVDRRPGAGGAGPGGRGGSARRRRQEARRLRPAALRRGLDATTTPARSAPRVAELLGLPQIGYARKVEAADGAVRCERSMDDMIETLEAPLPAVVTVVSEINEPTHPRPHADHEGQEQAAAGVVAGRPRASRRRAPVREIVSNLAEEQDRKHILFEGTAAEQADAFVDALINEGVLGR